jgi:hypothetical protein
MRLHTLAPVYGWTQPGHGVSVVVRSGVGAARLALGASTSMAAVPVRL